MILPIILLSWCGRPTTEIDTNTDSDEKQAFYITTSSVEELTTVNTISKSSRLVWAQEITVSSLVPWRVKNVYYNNWDTVWANTTIIELSDTWGSFSFNAQRAKAQLDSARINYEQTQRNLNKAITDSSLWVKQAETQLNAATKTGWGSASLQIQQLDEQIQKAELDYQTQLRNNQQTLNNFLSTAKNLAKDVELLYTDVVNENDKILWISQKYKNQNNVFEQKISAKNTAIKTQAEELLRSLIENESTYNNLWGDINQNNIGDSLVRINTLAKELQPLLDKMEQALSLTESSPNSLPESQLVGFKGTIDWLQWRVQGQIISITQQINAIESFLATYKEQEESLRRQVEITKQQVATTKSNLEDSETNAEIWIESAQNNLENAVQSKDTTLASLANSIEQARIAYSEAQNQLSKFSVKTPIQWSIGEILVDVWQEISPGTPLFTVSSSNEQQVEVSLSEEELAFVQLWQEVNIDIDGETRIGSIQSISNTADQNFTYKIIISLEWTAKLFGDVVDVKIPVRTAYPLIPLNVVSILRRNEWLVNSWNNNEIEPIKVNFWKVWWANVEIRNDLDPDTVLVISDIKNFNPNTQELKENMQP